MEHILLNILPVFLVIILGFFASRMNIIGEQLAIGLDRFVLFFAIPALLFRTMANVNLVENIPWTLWGSYFIATTIIWAFGLWISRHIRGLDEAGGSATAMSSSFGNLVLLGLPLAVSYFGDEALIPGALVVAIHGPLHWFAATLRVTWSQRESSSSFQTTIRKLVIDLSRNPIVVAIVIGLLWGATGIGLHPIANRTVELLGNAGIPTALFSLGLSLSAFGFKGEIRAVTAILSLKMVVFPLLAWIISTHIFNLSTIEASVITLFAAMPPGVNPYLFATRYRASVAPVSGAIFIGTGLSIFTTIIVLWLIGNS